jgi:hypothetical protein
MPKKILPKLASLTNKGILTNLGALIGNPMAPDKAPNNRKYVQTKGPTKTFQQDGHWIEKTEKTPIVICECGNRYLKTRPGQKVCLRCLSAMKN